MRRQLQQIRNLWSLIVGLFVTGDNLRRATVTVHYPRQEVDNLGSYRGPIELLPSAKDPLIPRCISCMMCMTTCPSGCITVVKNKAPKPTAEEAQAMADAEARGEKPKKPKAPKNPARFLYDYSLCSLCGLCAEVCPVDSIGFSCDAYMVVRDRGVLKMDLLARLKSKSGAADNIEEEVA
jgi:NADH-quinone oxidoreductase subunit I